MKFKARVLPHLLKHTAIELGCVIANPEHPLQRKYTSQDIEISENAGNLVISPGSACSDLQLHDRGAGLSVLLARLVKASLSVDEQQDTSLDTKLVKTYELSNSDAVFEQLCEEMEFQIWLEHTVKKSDAYFVVGMQTLSDAEVKLGAARKFDASGSGEVSFPSAGGETIFQTDARLKDEKGRNTQFTANEEQIYDLAIRKIKFGNFKPKEVENSHLSQKQVWLSTVKTRTSKSDQAVKVQASLCDDDDEAGLQVVSMGGTAVVLASEKTIRGTTSTP